MNSKLSDTFDKLFPIMRSITGAGFKESLALIDIPFDVHGVKSGTQIDDWTVPQEWEFRSATITFEDGTIVVDASVNNLHIINYSEPQDIEMSLEELLPYLHSLPYQPQAIPYITSYYKRIWGFCIADDVKRSLKPGKYRVKIDTSFIDGSLNFGFHRLQGKCGETIHLSSYLCHPSMANNELSGPLVLMGLYERIKNWPSQRYSYNFIINPETIGSLAYLNSMTFEGKIIAGFVLTCLGGRNPLLTYKLSRSGSIADKLIQRSHWRIRKFTPVNGSDERQYNAPGFKIPIGQIARDIPGRAPEYHTSMDTKEYMKIDRLVESIDEIEAMLKTLEISGHYINQKPYGEPCLSKYGLYPTLSIPDSSLRRIDIDRMLWILNYSDGSHDMMDIADKCECHVEDLRPLLEKLENAGLIK